MALPKLVDRVRISSWQFHKPVAKMRADNCDRARPFALERCIRDWPLRENETPMNAAEIQTRLKLVRPFFVFNGNDILSMRVPQR